MFMLEPTVHGPRKDILHVEGAVCTRKDPCHGHFEKAEIEARVVWGDVAQISLA